MKRVSMQNLQALFEKYPPQDLETLKRASFEQEQQEQRQARLNTYLSQVPERFKNKVFADFKIQATSEARCRKIAENYVNTFDERKKAGTCLQFLGQAGTGKTLLAFIMYEAIAKKGYSVKYEPSLHFLKLWQEKQFESYDAYNHCIETYKKFDFLILDEVSIGTGKAGMPADWQKTHFYALINARYLLNLPTLIISNHNQKELVERLGEPAIGRLSESGLVLAFDWASHRNI